MNNKVVACVAMFGSAVLIACSSSGTNNNTGDASEPVSPGEEQVLDFPTPVKHEFSTDLFDANSAILTNPYLMLSSGRTTVFEGETEDGFESIELVVLPETRIVNGVICAIVRDTVTIDGEPVEITDDWFAQDTLGRVWYMGEEVADYENGVLTSTAGSWEAGEDILDIGFTAEAGIQMFATPEVGASYYQEYYPTEATDAAEIQSINYPVTLADGTQYLTVQVKEWLPLEPTSFAYKYYAENVGLVLETDMNGEERIELVSIQD